jgi:hypothetical protein
MPKEQTKRTPLPGDDREGWMMFRYGGPLQLLELTPEQVDIRDITHGLAQINRFNGQSAIPISVLWHSLMVMQLCAAEDPATRLEALFHDAGEAYVGDWIRPLRSVMKGRPVELRDKIQKTVFEAAGLPDRSATLSEAVHRADNIMLRCEMQSPWGYGRIVSWYERPSPDESMAMQLALTRIGCPPRDQLARRRIRRLFLQHANRLVSPEAPIRASIDRAIKERH